jgi:hypothetical protein
VWPGSRGAPVGAAVGVAPEGTGVLLTALPMTELAAPAGVEAPGAAGVEDWPPAIGLSVAPGRLTAGVDTGKLTMGVDEAWLNEGAEDDVRVELEEVCAVLLGPTPTPPAALLVVLPASG